MSRLVDLYFSAINASNSTKVEEKFLKSCTFISTFKVSSYSYRWYNCRHRISLLFCPTKCHIPFIGLLSIRGHPRRISVCFGRSNWPHHRPSRRSLISWCCMDFGRSMHPVSITRYPRYYCHNTANLGINSINNDRTMTLSRFAIANRINVPPKQITSMHQYSDFISDKTFVGPARLNKTANGYYGLINNMFNNCARYAAHNIHNSINRCIRSSDE